MPPALLHPPDTHRLGKQDAQAPRMMIAKYVDVERALPHAPATVDNTQGGTIPLGMYLNNDEGDCTIAGVGNTLRVNSRGQLKITDADVQTGYVAVTGLEGAAFDPATHANDNGCVELDVLDYWTTVGIGGDKLLGHAGVNMADADEVRVICWLTGSIYAGVQLAIAQQSQQVWDAATGPNGSPGSWGGHCPPLFAVNVTYQGHTGVDLYGTWADYKPGTPRFREGYVDEGHALITDAWVKANQSNPLINTAALIADFAALAPEK